ncbi:MULTISPECIES: alanine--tRNA ligase [Thermoanaerobacterium]|uniref:Alanine--tRNA ligase n=1 Tax=Thermoanaerobacterium xylanolyticum (strain ATCC 49914 / DSM 7097 / LX-11) TaxID=858215 RepID=F6BKZ0_THEXL|nr:alanine--tRNA ligase [Thermoanaerobacterium xylanolyticum]AEF17174.1 alanyl-tRNA synthetase [Thermoanaerobacterium xylanolyticum LX-11]
MEKLGMNEIREKYLSFFESKGHLRLPSFSLVPKNDKSLLLINAGMAPLKPYFTGKEIPPSRRVTTCQKCIRTPDIDRVGKTARHGTFFEMLGNFSFGDYFKKEAIPWAWEFVTKVLELPEDRLWVTIYENDDEAFEIWNKVVGLPPERIVRMGKEDNFWEIGTGPCGPCSEIYFDRGEDKGCGKPTCGVGCDCDRFIEFWNLVFTQFDKDAEGNYNPLPKPNIDTGMGLERIATIMQEVDSIFDVDVIRGITDYVGKMAGVKYGADKKSDVSLRVITDHIRGVTFMISDGILPSNEGRGYVLRRLLRRAARYGKLLGLDRPFLYDVVDVVVEHYKGAYPEIQERKEYIKKVIKKEEERFKETIDQGLDILDGYINDLKASGKNVLEGSKAFKLYDTYGFPIELTKEILSESGMSVDEDGYQKELENQRLRARSSRKEDNALWEKDIYSTMKDIETKFVGYEAFKSDAKVLAIIKDDELVNSAEAGEEVNIILDMTPFYAESGGQVGDSGIIKSEDVYINIKDCKKAGGNKFVHIGTIERGILNVGDTVEAIIDEKNRMSTARNHTATHLLHSALRKFIGDHVHQAGSLVTPDRLRFDFTHYQALTAYEIKMIEDEVNEKIYESIGVSIDIMSQDEAIKKGAMALFQEKYGDVVRVVNISDYSKELCGGTHVTNTIQIGAFKIIAESGVAAGVRRIEAVTGLGALEFLNKKGELISNIEQILKVNEKDIVDRIADLSQTIKDLERQLEQLKSKVVLSMSDKLINSAEDINGIKFVSATLNDLDVDELKMMGDILKDRLKSTVIILATIRDEKINFVGMATKDAIERGINVGNIIREICQVADGKGGGRADMAQGVGNNLEKINIALETSRSLFIEKLK